MKPSWKTAPVWANWLAKDQNGEWFWHIEMPELRFNELGQEEWASTDKTSVDIYFADSLEQRPKEGK